MQNDMCEYSSNVISNKQLENYVYTNHQSQLTISQGPSILTSGQTHLHDTSQTNTLYDSLRINP